MATENEPLYPCRLYVITPPAFELDDFERALAEALEGGDVGCVQLRLKDSADAEIYAAARRLLPVCRQHEVAFIINDRPDIAAEVGADGVHLGQDDLAEWSVAKAKAAMGPDAVVGVSCHDSSHLAMEAGEAGADYVAFGAFHPTKSKDPQKLAQYGTPSVDMLAWWYHYTVLPCVAIGGMSPQNCGPMVSAGADFIAAITAVWEHKDGPKAAVAEFNQAIKVASKKRPKAEAA